MPKPSQIWDSLPPALWERLLAVVYIDADFEPAEAAEAAGFDPAQTAALKAWCARVEQEDRARRMAGALAPGTVKFLKSLRDDVDPAERQRLDAEIAAIMKKAGKAR